MRADRLRRYATDPAAFRADLLIPTSSGPRRFGDAMADFQRRDFVELDPSLLSLAAGQQAERRRYWIERTKGGSKDTDAAVCLLWLMAFSRRPLRVQVGAYDSSQADEIRLILRCLLRLDSPLNQLLAGTFDVQKGVILNTRTDSVCEILTTDSRGTHGSRPDVVLINELSHIGDQAFAETLFDNADKVASSVVVVCTNAGHRPSWQWDWRQIAIDSARWHFSALTKPAPWVSADDLRESERRNPTHRYRRLWHGVWGADRGDALSEADLQRAIRTDLSPHERAQPGWFYAGGVDIGTTHDHSAVCVLAVHPQMQKVRLAFCESWGPGPGGKVDLFEVRGAIFDCHRRFRCHFLFDPWQAEYMAVELQREGVEMQSLPFSGKNLNVMARCVVEAFRSGVVELYDDSALVHDLQRINIVEKQFGLKLEPSKNEHGHGDRAIAFALALPGCLGAIWDRFSMIA